MKERPIIMTAESVRAILDGRMTMTRRVVKPQPSDIRRSPFVPSGIEDNHGYEIKLAYGIPGDRLWVRETWAYIGKEPETDTVYKADGCWSDKPDWKWQSPRFMPRWASRLTLEVLNIRVERVQEISEEDAIAEGMEFIPVKQATWSNRQSYSLLWDTLHAKRGYPWVSNPYVWVIDFKVLP